MLRYGVPVVVGVVVVYGSAWARRKRHEREGKALHRKLLSAAQDDQGLCETLDGSLVVQDGALLGLWDLDRHMYAEVRLYRSGYASPCWWEMWVPHLVLDHCPVSPRHGPLQRTLQRFGLVKKEFDETLKANDETLHKLHARHAPGPHYYVAIVSTLPKNQGRGHCRELIGALNRAADLEGLPCLLECTRYRPRARTPM